jgi:hypothetical protein
MVPITFQKGNASHQMPSSIDATKAKNNVTNKKSFISLFI